MAELKQFAKILQIRIQKTLYALFNESCHKVIIPDLSDMKGIYYTGAIK
jgi:hypothetical protein